MVTLFGAHTDGVAHCGCFANRLSGKEADPSLDPELRAKLVNSCFKPNSRSEAKAFLDQNTSFVVDNEFYNQILAKRGVMKIYRSAACIG